MFNPFRKAAEVAPKLGLAQELNLRTKAAEAANRDDTDKIYKNLLEQARYAADQREYHVIYTQDEQRFSNVEEMRRRFEAEGFTWKPKPSGYIYICWN